MIDTQPWCVQIELTEGCNRICGFCGINGIRSKAGNFKYMTVHTAERLTAQMRELCPQGRVEFAMHGEPLQNPKHGRILAMFRAALPKAQLMVTTNGRVLMKKMQERLERLFATGINFVVLDTYYPERDALHAEAATLEGFRVHDFYDELAPQGWSPYSHHHGKANRMVVLMDDLGVRTGERGSRVIHNHAGSNPQLAPVPEPLAKTCTKPFRELSVTWNGEVRLCCEDWIGRYVAGNIHTTSLGDIWTGDAFEAARAKLQSKQRDFGACRACDANSGMRAGLLPKYPPVTLEQEQVVRAVEATTTDRRNLVETENLLQLRYRS